MKGACQRCIYWKTSTRICANMRLGRQLTALPFVLQQTLLTHGALLHQAVVSSSPCTCAAVAADLVLLLLWGRAACALPRYPPSQPQSRRRLLHLQPPIYPCDGGAAMVSCGCCCSCACSCCPSPTMALVFCTLCATIRRARPAPPISSPCRLP